LCSYAEEAAVKRLLVALGLGIAVFGAVFAAAATLGLTSDQLGAGDRAVSSCDSEVNVTYQNEYVSTLVSGGTGAPTTGSYRVSSVTLTDLAETACAGQTINVVLSGADGTSLGNAAGITGNNYPCCSTGNATTEILTVPAGQNIDPRLVYGVHVVITGQSNTAADTNPQP
jgi:hypothetical protein